MGTSLLNYASGLLYSLVVFEIIFFILVESYLLSLFQLSVISALLFIRSKQYVEPTKWGTIRQILQDLFIENEITEVNQSVKRIKNEDETALIKSSQQLAIFTNKELIQELRYLGVDAILICLFLLQYQDNLCSAKEFNTNLEIPSTTVYRNLQKLQNRNLIQSRTSLSDPKSTFFEITYEGRTLVSDLFNLIQKSI